GKYSEANASIASLRRISKDLDPQYPELLYIQHELFSKAKLQQAAAGVPFDEAFAHAFLELFNRLDDKSALHISTAFLTRNGVEEQQREVQKLLMNLKAKDSLNLTDAMGLCRNYYLYNVYKLIEAPAKRLLKDDDNKRYSFQDSVLIKTTGGATLSAIIVRKKGVTAPQPTALCFNIYTDLSMNLARRAASYGYVGVTAETRGKRLSPDEIDTYEHVAEDTYGVIDWITKQPWSDGNVGMFGGSYSGFAQWAATKKLHPALKTIVPYVANNPGDGLPMENNIFLFVNYAWAFYVTNNKYLDNETYFDRNRWNSLNDKWYASGKSYRNIDSIDGAPNKWLQRWLQHPDYDKYWQDLVPYRNEFAAINIPVLTITGYYDDGQQSALHYLKEHYKYNNNAEHYLLIGPYDHSGAQSTRKPSTLRGYAIDSVAQMDTPEITFQWLDYVMRDGTKPALLEDKINYEVMGANEWKHAPSLEALSNQTLTLYLTDSKTVPGDSSMKITSGDMYQLSKEKPSKPGFLTQEVDFADRKTTNNDYYPDLIVGKQPDLSNGFAFISRPFDEQVSINGTFSGEIKASINKKDMDIGVVLYEVMPNGELFHLSYFLGRASYASDMSVRKLLTPGDVESIPFHKTRMVSRLLAKGSRLLLTLNVNKNPYAQINYGTGKDVSDEDINDATTPLQLKWHNDSFVRIPIWK
ncbi:MAG TPA: CocE/NonD family hydrolase, partial [Bacteroidota bacterium]|nr:CocE/NonD family hydrolase [Bacteroidota bacterium]